MAKICRVLIVIYGLTMHGVGMAGTVGQKLWRLLNGTNLPVDDSEVVEMDRLISLGDEKRAARLATTSVKSSFVVSTVKSTFSPLGGREVTPSNPEGDFVLTLMMDTATEIPIRDMFLSDFRFTTSQASSEKNEAIVTESIKKKMDHIHFDGDLLHSSDIVRSNQNYLNPQGHLGLLTTLQYGQAIFEGGTNRRAMKRLAEDFLCVPSIENIVSYSLSDEWVGRDVDRAPGGTVSTYLNKCVGCHAGMDAARGAFASYTSLEGRLYYGMGVPHPKMNNNPQNFSGGHFVSDSSWLHLGWLPIARDKIGQEFVGPKALVELVVDSPEFYQCLVKRANKQMCPSKIGSRELVAQLGHELSISQQLRFGFESVAVDICL